MLTRARQHPVTWLCIFPNLWVDTDSLQVQIWSVERRTCRNPPLRTGQSLDDGQADNHFRTTKGCLCFTAVRNDFLHRAPFCSRHTGGCSFVKCRKTAWNKQCLNSTSLSRRPCVSNYMTDSNNIYSCSFLFPPTSSIRSAFVKSLFVLWKSGISFYLQ